MFAIILIATLLAAGGASVNANPSGLGQIPNIVPAGKITFYYIELP